jgi:very-short-patch-repair endonuclease
VNITQKLERSARAHHGLVTQVDWIAAGNSRRSWFRAHGDLLIPCGPGVARFAGVAKTPEQRIHAAVLATTGTLASHRSAAHLWGVDLFADSPVDLIQTSRSKAPKLHGVIIHRPTDLAELRPVDRQGIPTTNPMRTLLDLGAVAPSQVAPALDQLLIKGTVTVAGLNRTLLGHRIKGRHGVGALSSALEKLTLGSKPPDSVLEPAMAKLFERHGLNGWIFHPYVLGYELDFAFPLHRLNIEVDGWATHGRRESFERDRQRDAELGAAGWHVTRFTWRSVTRRPKWVAATIAATIAHRLRT